MEPRIFRNNDDGFDSTSLGNACPPCKSGRLAHSEAHKESEVAVLSDSEEENGDELNIGLSATSAFVGSDNLGPGGSLMLNCQEVLPEGAQVDSSHIPFMLVHLYLNIPFEKIHSMTM